MFAWIIGSSLKFRFLVLAVACGVAGLRHPAASQDARRRIPRVRSSQGRDPDRRSGHDLRRGGGADHDSDGGSAARRFRTSTSSAPRRSSALSQVMLLFKPGTDLMAARQRVSERVKLAIAELPQSAGMPVMLQPLSSTSRVMKIGHLIEGLRHDGPVDDRLLDDQVPPDVGPRRREHSHLGRSDQVVCKCRSIRA